MAWPPARLCHTRPNAEADHRLSPILLFPQGGHCLAAAGRRPDAFCGGLQHSQQPPAVHCFRCAPALQGVGAQKHNVPVASQGQLVLGP